MLEESVLNEIETAYRAQAEDVGIKPPEKFEVNDYTTFRVEYLFREDDIVVHFYKTAEMAANPTQKGPSVYWGRTFPEVLSREAQEFFGASRPRLEAAYTEEVDSWYFRARGYVSVSFDPHGYLKKFLEILDQALDKAKGS